MKIQVLHDEQGNILSFAVVKSGIKDGLSLVPKPNQSTKIVNLPSKKDEKTSSEKDFTRIAERIQQYRIDTSDKKGKLIRKTT